MYQINNSLAGLEQLVLLIELHKLALCIAWYVCITSSSLKAARLFKPWTRASLAKKSFPCRDFHRVDDDEARRAEVTIVRLHELHAARCAARQENAAGMYLGPSSKLSVSCWKTRRDSMRAWSITRGASPNFWHRCGSCLSIPDMRLRCDHVDNVPSTRSNITIKRKLSFVMVCLCNSVAKSHLRSCDCLLLSSWSCAKER